MSVDRSLRSAFAAILLVAALFIAMNRIVASAPVADWFLPLALFIVGAALLPNWNLSRSRSDVEADETLSGADVHTYRIEAQQVPRLHTMTIRPDPETSERVVTITEDTVGDVLPFIETEVVPGITPTPPPAVPTTPAPAPSATSHNEAAEPEGSCRKRKPPSRPRPTTVEQRRRVSQTRKSSPRKPLPRSRLTSPRRWAKLRQNRSIRS